MTKYLYTVVITVNGADAQTLTDTATYEGAGSAWSQIIQKQDVCVKKADGSTLFIPFHAISMATMTRTSSTVADPVDAFCETDEGGEG